MLWTNPKDGNQVLNYNIVDGFHGSDSIMKLTIRPIRS